MAAVETKHTLTTTSNISSKSQRNKLHHPFFCFLAELGKTPQPALVQDKYSSSEPCSWYQHPQYLLTQHNRAKFLSSNRATGRVGSKDKTSLEVTCYQVEGGIRLLASEGTSGTLLGLRSLASPDLRRPASSELGTPAQLSLQSAVCHQVSRGLRHSA